MLLFLMLLASLDFFSGVIVSASLTSLITDFYTYPMYIVLYTCIDNRM